MQLDAYMDEQFLTSVFAHFGFHAQSIRGIRNYQTGYSTVRSELAS